MQHPDTPTPTNQLTSEPPADLSLEYRRHQNQLDITIRLKSGINHKEYTVTVYSFLSGEALIYPIKPEIVFLPLPEEHLVQWVFNTTQYSLFSIVHYPGESETPQGALTYICESPLRLFKACGWDKPYPEIIRRTKSKLVSPS